MSYKLEKPYEEQEKIDFIFRYNQDCFQEGYKCHIEETETAIYALEENEILDGNTVIIDPDYEAKKAQERQEYLATLSLTKREVFLALYHDKGITPEQLRAQISSTEALIEFDYAEKYYRGNPLINTIGIMLGYTEEDLNYLFEHKELPEN